MNSELTHPSINSNNQDSNQENKLQGQMLRTQELTFYGSPLNIQCVKKKEVRILRYARDIYKTANIQHSKMQQAIFKSSKAIKELDIQYYRLPCEQYKMVGYLMENIKRLRSLQTLKLIIDWKEEDMFFDMTSWFICSHLHDGILRRISHGLERLTSLQNFSFFFTNCDIDDKRLTKICRILKRMRNLKNLTLDFEQCGLLRGASLHTICKNLKKIKGLQIVNLDVSKCMWIYEKDLHLVLQDLQTIPSLQTLNFQLLGCVQISNLQFENLHFYLNQLTSLKRFSLDLSGCHFNDQKV